MLELPIELTEDFIIPKWTIFKNIDNSTRDFIDWHYETIIGTSDGTTMNIQIDREVLLDRGDIFRQVKD
jgi:hypothetical protein